MKAVLSAVLISLLLVTACTPPPSVERGAGPVLVTVFAQDGAEAASRDGLFASYGLGVDQAATLFDAEALAGLPVRRIEADFPVAAAPRTFSGPSLADVLAASGARGASVRLTAFDGYQVEVSADMIARHRPILATHVEGEALPVGGLGPVMLVWPRPSDDQLAEMNDDLWPWGVFAIETLD
jgi:hypothetical protein